ncbi:MULTISPECIES: SGNH/GDSL hydrolase family protein [Candidatus Ichthyocystis]|uniref:Putative outer membrane lipase/esterase n=1 Tax=Candidatus Ichthyocystis hellenicum TaxID=1561003 RepID=A0A0S4M138_9BURK|nr:MULTISPECIES: SGNH/GDSL hydrolase family protein [Ichthyocystis]CUT17491.1 putative outer membrane lipase/esterase [Candidatus Ichthyocystis hellenicum]
MVGRFRVFFAVVAFFIASSCCFADDDGMWSFTFFGDSLVAQDGGIGGRPFTSIGYPMWTELFGRHFGDEVYPASAGGTNFAVPGAETENVLDSVKNWTNSIHKKGGIVFFDGGGNDIFHQISKHFLDPDLEKYILMAVESAVVNTKKIVEVISSDGASLQILTDLPLLGITPAAHAFHKEAELNAVTAYFNAKLQATVSDLNRGGNGVNLLVLDWATLMSEILSNYEDYGFKNVTDSGCTDSVFSTAGPCAVDHWKRRDAPSYYFFMDGKHPGGAAEKIISDYSQSVLEAPILMGVLPRIPAAMVLSHKASVDNVLAGIRAGVHNAGDWIFSGTLAHGNYDINVVSPVIPPSPQDNSLAISWTYVHPDATSYSGFTTFFSDNYGYFNGDRSSYLMNWFGITTYHQRFFKNWLLTAKIGGIGIIYPFINREIPMGISFRNETSRTNGYGAWGEISAFYPWKSFSSLTYGPVLDAIYRYTFIRGFSETARNSTSMRFFDQKLNSFRTSIGWLVKGNFSWSGHALSPFVTLWLTRENVTSKRYVYASLITFPSVFHLPVYVPGKYSSDIETGLSGNFDGYMWSLGATGSVYSKAARQFSVNLSISRKFL